MKILHRSSLPVLVVLLLAFVVRLYGFSNPLAEWHSWRQVDTSAVSREFVQQGFDILHPKFHDLSNVPSGKDNPQGYRFVEFPLYNILQAGGYLLLQTITLEEWGRLISILSSVGSTLFLYLLVRKHADGVVGFWAASFFAILPFNVFYGRTVLPDPSMVCAVLGGIFFFDEWIDRKKNTSGYVLYILAVLFTASALLLKPYAVFFVLPMLVRVWQKYGVTALLRWHLWLFAVLTIVPLLWWRVWMMQYPEGIPYNDWLLNGGGIRFKGAFFYWLFADRIGRMISGYWGLVLLTLGALVNSNPGHLKKHGIFFYSFLASSLLYLTVFARGNVQHDYYQILIIPSLAIFYGFGARVLLFPPKEYVQVWISRVLFVCVTAFTIGFGWFGIRDFYNINNRAIIVAGEAADRLTPKDAKIIVPYEGDTTALYFTNRKGWASFQNPLPELISKGATHLLLLNPSEKDVAIGQEYKVIGMTKEYLLFDLRQHP